MDNFELRWLERETGKTCMNEHGYYYQETTRILQYRYTETVTDYKIPLADNTYHTNKVWTAWKDIPEVKEA